MALGEQSGPVIPIERYREYLHLLARLQLDPRFAEKADASDIVQETFLKAHSGMREFTGESESERQAWLRAILTNTIIDTYRRFAGGGKRDLNLERSIHTSLSTSASRLEIWLADERSSPSARAQRNERVVELANALAELPNDQRRALELKYLQGKSLPEIAKALNRTRASVA